MRHNHIRKIEEYLEMQEAKGLIFETAREAGVTGTYLYYETYWTTHTQIIMPEIRRIVLEGKLQWEIHTKPLETAVDYVAAVLML